MKINIKKRQLLIPVLTAVFLLLTTNSVRAQIDEESGYDFISSDETWGAGEHFVEKGVFIDDGATLNIEKGAHIIFKKTSEVEPFIQIGNGRIVADGSDSEKIIFEAADETSKNYNITLESAQFEDVSFFRYVDFIDGGINFGEGGGGVVRRGNIFGSVAYAAQITGYGTLNYKSGKLHLENSTFDNGNYFSVVASSYFSANSNGSGFLEIINSNFENNPNNLAVISSSRCDATIIDCSKKVLLKNNWYGDSAGPISENNLDGQGAKVEGLVMIDGWATVPFGQNITEGFSNVMFLPGIKSSRLYKKGGMFGTEDKLWPPNFFGNDLEDLRLSDDGTSLESVYTRDVVDEVAIPMIGGNIYKTFLEKLSDMKADKTINDYEAFAYDWRQDVEDIAKNGTMYPDEIIKSAIDDLDQLSQTSKSKKVTIVAHSNGGLLAKAIMQELESRGLADRVDKIVFVGTPQMGTPLAILSLLYGYDESALFGTLISREDSRIMVENMPGAYGLLPSGKYFDRLQEPLLTFSSSHSKYKDFADFYEGKIDNIDNLENFLSGKEGRTKPESDDLENENILNETLIDKAMQMHDRLDNWTPPSDVEVIQIAGWGLDTISGVEYTEEEEFNCSTGIDIPTCSPTGKYLPVYNPKFTVDGDEVVVAPSALMMEDAPNVKRYWVDLFGYNAERFNVDREHKNIFELTSVGEFIQNVVSGTYENSKLPEYFSKNIPYLNNESSRIRMSLYSPLDIHLYDDFGNHTGPVTIDVNGESKTVFEESIPNSYYYQFGDRKYVGMGGGQKIKVEMDGYAVGTYTLKLEEISVTEKGDEVISHTTFANLPTTDKAKITLNLSEDGIVGMSELEADLDGDEINDYTVEKMMNGTATLDTISPTISISSPEEGKQYLNNQILKFGYLVEDNVSKLDNIQTEVLYDEKLLKIEELDLSLEKLGEHSFTVIAKDEAGNKSEKKIDFKYITSFQTISENINHYYKLKLITDRKSRDFLQVKVHELMHVQNMIAKHEGRKNSNAKLNLIKLKNKKIDELIKFINGKIKKETFGARELLIDNLNFLKN